MFIQNLLYGCIIGIGFIIPGVSGSVIATILGVYEKTIDALLNLKKDIKNNFLFLIPLFLGIFCSILLFSKLVLYLINNKLNFISYVFIGLIIGCIPYLFKEIKCKTNKNISYPSFILAFVFGIFLFILENNFMETYTNPSIIIMIIAGTFYSFGKIVPGISGAALLMLLGVYKYFLNILANPFNISLDIFYTLIPFIISFLLSSIVILKLINYLFQYHFRLTYSAIIGFVISSIFFIYPGSFNISSLVILICSFLISYNLIQK